MAAEGFSDVKVALVINKMSRAKYDELSTAGEIEDNQIYMVSDSALDANGSQVTNVADPVSSQDAATKGYVDSSIGNLSTDFKASSLSAESFAQGEDAVASGQGSTATGKSTTASGAFSEAHGARATAASDFSYVWSGDKDNDYTGHGEGTFSVNSKDGLSGFYIGDQTLQQHLAQQVDPLCVQISSEVQATKESLSSNYAKKADTEISYSSDSKRIYLSAGDHVTSIDASQFVKDGMISDVTYDSSTHIATITWNTSSGTVVTDINVSDFIDLNTLIYAVDALPPLADLTSADLGKVFLLKHGQAGYILGHFYKVDRDDFGNIAYIDIAELRNIPLGTVTQIRFSFIDGTLNVYWRDPDDVFLNGSDVAKFGFTRLIAKAGSYPESPNDGQVLIDSSVKNQYVVEPAVFKLDKTQTWYCRFFPCTSTGVWSTETPYPTDNRFSTDSYSWDLIYKYLEDYSRSSFALPAEGDTFYLDYMINDYWTEGTTKKAANTRQLVMDHLDQIQAHSLPWRVLGYNANVPQYVKYRMRLENFRGTSTTDPLSQVVTIGGTVITDAAKNDTVQYRVTPDMDLQMYIFDGSLWVSYDAFAEYDYKWVSSADDKQKEVEFFDSVGISMGVKKVLCGEDETYGPGWQRPIAAGCRVYDMSYNAEEGRKEYTDAKIGTSFLSVNSASDSKFRYDNNGVGQSNAYGAPIEITITDGTHVSAYHFCGYTMTVQPQNCLNGVNSGGTLYYNIQFDAAEQQYASPWNSYETSLDISSDYGYYWKDDDGKFHVIDIVNETLIGSHTQDYNGYDVWKLQDNGEVLRDTCYFENNHKYARKNSDGTYVRQDVIIPFEQHTVYYASNTNKSYDSSYNGGVANDYVGRFDSDGNLTAIYKCIKQTPATYDKTPETDTASFTKDNTILASGNYVVVGQKIPVDDSLFEVRIKDREYGCNLYSESFFRQYINNPNGNIDNNYKKMNRFDVVSTAGLRNVNGPMLKLAKEQQFISHIVPIVNITVLSPYNRQFRRAKLDGSTWTEHVADMFWPLAYYETFGSGIDGSCIFNKVLGDNEKRKKYYVAANGTVGSAANWLLRNPYTGYSHYEYIVTTSGASDSGGPRVSFGCAPACTLG